ncbi:MAG TPA: tRNA lysidine(34) synthetase TilS, partial [Clostridia bacterium]
MKINLPERIKKTIADNSLIESGDSVLVGVSGGPDSVCLLHALSSLACDLGITLHAFHLNHMLRKEESNRDENYVRYFCIKFGIQLHVKQADILEASKKMGLSIEEAGREVRYEFLTEISNEINAGKIAVAHNSNDQAETVIMRLIRGTGLDGLKGMDYKRGKIIRPLLDISRKEIEEYCDEFGLNPVTDSSNLSDVYMRNRIRL